MLNKNCLAVHRCVRHIRPKIFFFCTAILFSFGCLSRYILFYLFFFIHRIHFPFILSFNWNEIHNIQCVHARYFKCIHLSFALSHHFIVFFFFIYFSFKLNTFLIRLRLNCILIELKHGSLRITENSFILREREKRLCC